MQASTVHSTNPVHAAPDCAPSRRVPVILDDGRHARVVVLHVAMDQPDPHHLDADGRRWRLVGRRADSGVRLAVPELAAC